MNSSQQGSVLQLGTPLSQARSAIILLHGRGSSGSDIARLVPAIEVAEAAFLAPTAPGGSWYPERFLAPLESNEPWLSQALDTVDDLIEHAAAAGIARNRIALVGFSQGACLALERLSRRPEPLGFVAALSGALIGPPETEHEGDDLHGIPVLLACAEEDAHIPVDFVRRSAEILASRGAEVTTQIFPGDAHTVLPFELDWIKARLNQRPRSDPAT